MPKSKPPYPAEFRQQMVELVEAGRSPAELAREFRVSAQSIHTWVAQAHADARKSPRGREVLTSAERQELSRLRQEVRRLKTERDILAKATAWFAGKNERTFTGSTNS